MFSLNLAERKRSWVLGLSVVVALMTGLVAYSPELYRIFCDVTGYGGNTQRIARSSAVASGNEGSTLLPEVTVYFDANTDKRLPWRFVPEQRSVTVRVGEPKQIFYRAHNLSNKTIVGQATFNVTPFHAGSYFFKSECFCFSEQSLKPGQEARMPVVFYLEEEMLADDEVSDIRDITLSYTFYRLKDLEEEGGMMDHSEHADHSEEGSMMDHGEHADHSEEDDAMDHGEHADHSEEDDAMDHGEHADHSEEDDAMDHGEHADHSESEIDNLHETGKHRMESIKKGDKQNFTPAGVRKSS